MPIFLNPHTRLDFSSDNQYFYRVPLRNISDKFTIIKDLCRFLQPGLISSTTLCKKIDFPTANHKKYINLLSDWFPVIGNTYLELKLLKNIFKIYCYNNKDSQNLSNNEIHFTFQSNSTTKYNRPFKFPSWPNLFEGHYIISPDI